MSKNPTTAYIKDITENEFDEFVVKQSADKLILVDFWAGWCNPCKMLAPLLESVVTEYDGSVLLAKVDTDKEKNLAAAFGIKSLPTVVLFKQGEIVDKFMGVIPESDIRKVIEVFRFNENDALFEEAFEQYEENDLEAAKSTTNKILQNDDSYLKATVLLAKIHTKQKQYDDAEHILQHVSINKLDHPLVKEAVAFNHFYRDAPESETIESLHAKPDSTEKHFQLGCLHAIETNYEAALEEFIEVMKSDRKFKDDGARKHMLAIFDMLGSAGPLVNTYRIKMARLLH